MLLKSKYYKYYKYYEVNPNKKQKEFQITNTTKNPKWINKKGDFL
jgi:hypothetical protein